MSISTCFAAVSKMKLVSLEALRPEREDDTFVQRISLQGH